MYVYMYTIYGILTYLGKLSLTLAAETLNIYPMGNYSELFRLR